MPILSEPPFPFITLPLHAQRLGIRAVLSEVLGGVQLTPYTVPVPLTSVSPFLWAPSLPTPGTPHLVQVSGQCSDDVRLVLSDHAPQRLQLLDSKLQRASLAGVKGLPRPVHSVTDLAHRTWRYREGILQQKKATSTALGCALAPAPWHWLDPQCSATMLVLFG